jgi:squalene-associated FAD-dependent desaturase
MSIVVIGGGWSGLAAAVRLCQQGLPVHLIEAADRLGGRARNVDWHGFTVDNGQHLMIGAYHHTLQLLSDVGASEPDMFERRPLDVVIRDPQFPDLHIQAGRYLPWPLSLAWQLVRHNGWKATFELSRLALSARRFHHDADSTVADWLQSQKQSPRLVRQLWEPLCLATLNTPINEASAAVFANVLKEIFLWRHHSDLLLPRKPLGQTLPAHAQKFIEQHGGKISLNCRVQALQISDGQVQHVRCQNGDIIAADHVVLALPATASQRLLGENLPLHDAGSYPITTVYLQYPPQYQLKTPLSGFSGTLVQWLFDRDDLRPGLIAAVISGPGEHLQLTKAELVQQLVAEIKQQHPDFPDTALDALVIREKRATFASTVDIRRQRPNNRTEITGLWLAGDYVVNPYPATLEGAVINGEQTAMQLMEHIPLSR